MTPLKPVSPSWDGRDRSATYRLGYAMISLGTMLNIPF
jgi:hypothetical protein